MPALSSELRRQLENVCVQARDVAEAAARSALSKRAVDAAEPFPHFNHAEKEQRNRLRARGRQVGDVCRADKTQTIDQLTQELAYEFWHRMLFARFLAENHLLMHPDGVAISLEECDELAPSADPPAPNGFALAARYASTMLPQIFRTDDVLLEIEFAPEQRLALEKALAGLPRQTFLADDSLGWVYQFWQTKRKDEVNKSGEKIDGRTLPAVTQLFTEHYMVQFLLHNTIGAWWCARHGVKGPAGGAGVPAGQAPVEMEYLRWRDDGTPAAGAFDGWPKTLAEFTMLDPCCGSGHFLVSAFNLLVPLRMHEEKLSAEKACEAVLRDNLFGLELDPRCTQIAAFALALAAWKYPSEGGPPLGYRPLPALNIACCGQAAVGQLKDWKELAKGTADDGFTVGTLYHLFQKAGDLGSLIDTSIFRREPLFRDKFVDVRSALASLFRPEKWDADATAMAVAAQGIATAADILSGTYTLLATNVPYLGRGKQAPVIAKHLEDYYPEGKADLATAFVLRCLELCRPGGSTALVTPQNWLFLTTYKKLREMLLKERTWNAVARLGEHAFESPAAAGAFAALTIISAEKSADAATMAGVDVAAAKTAVEKASRLADREPTPVQVVRQAEQLRNPDAIIAISVQDVKTRLGDYVDSYHGISTTDYMRFGRCHWESSGWSSSWILQQGTVEKGRAFSGREMVLLWEEGRGGIEQLRDAGCPVVITGLEAWGKRGIVVSQMRGLPCGIFTGQAFDDNVAVLVPRDPNNLLPVWTFCSSEEFSKAVREINQKMIVQYVYYPKVVFDLAYWQQQAARRYPHGLPEPQSDDPTQWLFKGDIVTSTDPLQVSVARLLGYRWPDQPKQPAAVDSLVDADGVVCLPGVRGEPPAAERLLEVLHAAYGDKWSDAFLHMLLTDAGCKAGTTLDDWLRNQFFEQHCKRFHQRPFVWHITDGRHKDGFSALVNYHKLNHKTLENLTYSYLGDWISAQAADAKAGKTGADLRLKAAQDLQEKLKAILAGEPPYDIFVRWKPLSEQPIGWNPDLNDGVRVNIRPFVEAGILRKNPNIKWTKDRGNEPERDKDEYPWFWSGDDPCGDRVNNVHLTNDEKAAARKRKKGAS
jgi:hypothetical protein